MLLGLGAIGAIGVTAGVIGAYYYVQPSLPPAETIRDIPLQVPLRIFSRDGYLISEIGERRRIPVTYEELPQHVVHAFVAAEDRRFFEHPGIDYRGILRAFRALATTGNASGGGGSTLTQQLARDYFLTREQTCSASSRRRFSPTRLSRNSPRNRSWRCSSTRCFSGSAPTASLRRRRSSSTRTWRHQRCRSRNAGRCAAGAVTLQPGFQRRECEVRRGYVLGRMRDLGYIDDSLSTRRWRFRWSHVCTARPSN